MLYGRFVHVGKSLTDLQILGSEVHQNAFGGRAPPGPAGGATALPQTPYRFLGEGNVVREWNEEGTERGEGGGGTGGRKWMEEKKGMGTKGEREVKGCAVMKLPLKCRANMGRKLGMCPF